MRLCWQSLSVSPRFAPIPEYSSRLLTTTSANTGEMSIAYTAFILRQQDGLSGNYRVNDHI